ncbi:MAG: amidohydrolase family protein [Polyangiaceae bacterium]
MRTFPFHRRARLAGTWVAMALGMLGCEPREGDLPFTGPVADADGGDAGTSPDGSAVGTSDGGSDAAPIDEGEGAQIAPGATDRIVLFGTILGPEGPYDGSLLVAGTTIACAGPGDACAASAEAAGATVVRTNGIVAPGLVDTHNHILFDIFDDSDWLPSMSYENHDQWTKEVRYGAMLDVKQCLANDSQGKPAWCAGAGFGTPDTSLRCEMDKWGELKGLVAGTTSIVGLPGTSSACFGSLARSVDVAQSGLEADRVQTSATFPPSNPTGVCTNVASGRTQAFLVHCGEGVDARSRDEFVKLGSSSTPADCLYAPTTTITHGTAFGDAEFGVMAAQKMKLTWSPASNVALYGTTTDVPKARAAGIEVALAPDWSMGGSPNLLDELRFAAKWDQDHWQGSLGAKDLVAMVTTTPARVLALEGTIGVIQKGALADIAVFGGDVTRPYESVVAASPKEVRLVLVGGTVLYGDMALLGSAATNAKAPCEKLDVCGREKFVCVSTGEAVNKFDQTFAEIESRLEEALVRADKATPEDGYAFAPLAPLVRCR